MSADHQNPQVSVEITLDPSDFKALKRFMAGSPGHIRPRRIRRVVLVAVVAYVLAILTPRDLSPLLYAGISAAYIACLVVGSHKLVRRYAKTWRQDRQIWFLPPGFRVRAYAADGCAPTVCRLTE